MLDIDESGPRVERGENNNFNVVILDATVVDVCELTLDEISRLEIEGEDPLTNTELEQSYTVDGSRLDIVMVEGS